jgi:hypothetical protein
VILDGAHHVLQMRLVVAHEGQHGHQVGADQDTGIRQSRHCPQPQLHARAARFEGALQRRVDAADRVGHPHPRPCVDVNQQVEIAGQQRRALDDEQREAKIAHNLQHAARQSIAVLRRTLPVADRDHVARQLGQLVSQQLHGVDLDADEPRA